jgi:hypothetical protein
VADYDKAQTNPQLLSIGRDIKVSLAANKADEETLSC